MYEIQAALMKGQYELRTKTQTSSETESTYRDRIATIDDAGKRNWIYPKKQGGRFFRARTYVSWFLLAFLIAAPS